MHTKGCLLHNAAKALRQDILDYENSLPDLTWPLQVETLKERMECMRMEWNYWFIFVP